MMSRNLRQDIVIGDGFYIWQSLSGFEAIAKSPTDDGRFILR
jgi:hypothetical protein